MKHLLVVALFCATQLLAAQIVWSDDFSNPFTWVIDHDGPVDGDWQIGVGLQNQGSFPTPPIQSTTAANGYAMFDSDGLENTSGDIEQAHITTATPLDLSTLAQPRLRFENLYRHYADNTSTCYVVISTDGTFSELSINQSTASTPNIFRLFDEVSAGGTTDDPEVIELDITEAVVGNPSTVWVRFYWAGEFAYTWFIDDVSIFEGPQVDLVLSNAGVSNSQGTSQIGSVPQAQVGIGMYMGGVVENPGIEDLNNVVLNVDITGPTPFSTSFPIGSMASGDSVNILEFVPLPVLSQGSYQVVLSLDCDLCDTDANALDNSANLYFNVNNDLYALDALAATPPAEAITSVLGTNSFANEEDGIFLLSFVRIHTEAEVHGFEALLGGQSQVGGLVVFSVFDSLDVVTSNLTVSLFDADVYELSAADIANGRVSVVLDEAMILQPGAYYVAAALFSNFGSAHVEFLDDFTIPENSLALSGQGSMIYLQDEMQVYANGNAFAIRLQMGQPVPCNAEFEVTQSLDDLGEPVPFSLTILNTSSSEIGSYDALWEFGDGATSTDPFPQHDYAAEGPYEICLTISESLGCVDQMCDSISVDQGGLFGRSTGISITVVDELPTAIAPAAGIAPLSLTSDPPSGLLRFSRAPISAGQLFDATGRLCLSFRSGQSAVDIQRLRPGAYTVLAEDKVLRFVKY